MNISYTEEKIFTKEQIQELFLSVNWVSGQFPECLYKALMNSSTVLTAWDENRLVGLIRVLDDTEMLAQPRGDEKSTRGSLLYIYNSKSQFLRLDFLYRCISVENPCYNAAV